MNSIAKRRRGIIEMFKDTEFKDLGLIALILLLIGTVFYTYVEHWRPLDAFYFSATTLTTIGYGDHAPKTDLGKLFTVVYIFAGVGTILSFVHTLAQHARTGKSSTRPKRRKKS